MIWPHLGRGLLLGFFSKLQTWQAVAIAEVKFVFGLRAENSEQTEPVLEGCNEDGGNVGIYVARFYRKKLGPLSLDCLGSKP